MTTVNNTFEGGTDNLDISVANSGGSSGNAFDAISVGTGAQAKYDTSWVAHGSVSATFVTSTTAATSYLQWDQASLGTPSEIWVRGYVRVDAHPSAARFLMEFRDTNANVLNARLQMTTSGALVVQNGASSTIFTTTNTLTANVFYRVELHFVLSATVGVAELWLYDNIDSTTALEHQVSAATQNLGSSACNRMRFGWVSSAASLPNLWFDDVAFSDVGALGPAATSKTASDTASAVEVGSTGVSGTVDKSASDTASASASATAVQLVGTTQPTMVFGTTANYGIEMPNNDDASFTRFKSEMAPTAVDYIHSYTTLPTGIPTTLAGSSGLTIAFNNHINCELNTKTDWATGGTVNQWITKINSLMTDVAAKAPWMKVHFIFNHEPENSTADPTTSLAQAQSQAATWRTHVAALCRAVWARGNPNFSAGLCFMGYNSKRRVSNGARLSKWLAPSFWNPDFTSAEKAMVIVTGDIYCKMDASGNIPTNLNDDDQRMTAQAIMFDDYAALGYSVFGISEFGYNTDAFGQTTVTSTNTAQESKVRDAIRGYGAAAGTSSATYSENFEAVAVGVALTTTNTFFDTAGGTTGTAVAAGVTQGTTMIGSRYARLTTGAAQSISFIKNVILANAHSVSAYVRLGSLPTTNTVVFNARNNTTVAGGVRFDTAGTLTLRDGSSAVTGGTSAHALTVNKWYRIEWKCDFGTGVQELRIYDNPTSTTPIETLAPAASFTTSAVNNFNIGITSAVSSWQLDLDGIQVNDSPGTFPGPWGTAGAVGGSLGEYLANPPHKIVRFCNFERQFPNGDVAAGKYCTLHTSATRMQGYKDLIADRRTVTAPVDPGGGPAPTPITLLPGADFTTTTESAVVTVSGTNAVNVGDSAVARDSAVPQSITGPTAPPPPTPTITGTPLLITWRTELALTTSPTALLANQSWTDISAYVAEDQSTTLTRGRADELSDIQPSTLSLTVDNTDGRFTPGNTSSPYYPNLNLGVLIRRSATVYDEAAGQQVYYPRFTGYVDSIDVPEWSIAPFEKVATIAASDRLARLGSAKMGTMLSMVDYENLNADPTLYYPLTEESDAGIAHPISLGAHQEPLQIVHYGGELAFGSGVPVPSDERGTVSFSPVINDANQLTSWNSYLRARMQTPIDYSANAPLSLSAFITPSAIWDSTQVFPKAVMLTADDFQMQIYIDASTNQIKGIVGDVPQVNFTTASGPIPAIGKTYHVALVAQQGTPLKLYVNDVLYTGGTVPVMTKQANTLWVGAPFAGSISNVALFRYALDSSAVDLIYDAGTRGTARMLADDALLLVAGYAGIPSDEINSTPRATTLVDNIPLAGRTRVEVLNEIAKIEGGILFVDGFGVLQFHTRAKRWGVSVPQFAFPTADVKGTLAVAYTDDFIVNDSMVTRTGGGTGRSQDSVSKTRHGIYAESVEFRFGTNNEPPSRARYRVKLYAFPKPRLGVLPANLTTSLAQQALLSLDIGTLVTIESLGAGAPTALSLQWIEGISEAQSADDYTITFALSPYLDDSASQYLRVGSDSIYSQIGFAAPIAP